MNFILIGKGVWGKKLLANLKKIGNVKKIINSKIDYKKTNLKNIDWVIISSPNKFHYNHVKYFLKNKINIFCEKPLTLNFKLTKKLIRISEKNNTKLYISDIELFKKKKIIIKKNNYILRSKFCDYDFKKTLFALAYHDFYLLSKYFSNVKNNISIVNKTKKLYHFKIIEKKIIFDFKYNLNSHPEHKINKTNFNSKKNYILKMFKDVFSLNVNFKDNHDRALKASYLIHRILKLK